MKCWQLDQDDSLFLPIRLVKSIRTPSLQSIPNVWAKRQSHCQAPRDFYICSEENQTITWTDIEMLTLRTFGIQSPSVSTIYIDTSIVINVVFCKTNLIFPTRRKTKIVTFITLLRMTRIGTKSALKIYIDILCLVRSPLAETFQKLRRRFSSPIHPRPRSLIRLLTWTHLNRGRVRGQEIEEKMVMVERNARQMEYMQSVDLLLFSRQNKKNYLKFSAVSERDIFTHLTGGLIVRLRM